MLVALIVVVIILSGFFYFQSVKQGSANLTITSAIVKPSYYSNSNYYTLHIDSHIKFNGQITVTGYLNVCSFDLSLNSSKWSYYPITCTGDISTLTYSGSHDFILNFGIEPLISNSTIATPFNLSFMVFSSEFNVTSQYYNLAVTNSSELQTSLKITHASLDNFTKKDGSLGYNISTTFYLRSNHSFNITYDCSNPFTVELVNSTFSLTQFCYSTDFTFNLPSGTSNYTLTSQLYLPQINPQSQNYNYTSLLPSSFYIQVILGNYFLKSNLFTFSTD